MKDERLETLLELTRVGAEDAAAAFSQLTRSEVRMREPSIRIDDGWPASLGADWNTGVLFELEGCLEAVVAILFREEVRDGVVRRMLGEPEAPLARESVEAVLMELGNILVSRVASAIADRLGERLLPTIPILALDDAADAIAGLCEQRAVDPEARVECDFQEAAGELGGRLVLVPRLPPRRAQRDP